MNYTIDEIDKVFKEITMLNYNKNFKNLENIGLYPGQPIILEKIYYNEGITQSELSQMCFKKPSTITTMINRLIKPGYIKRMPDANDHRIYRLYLTKKGKDKCIEAINVRQKFFSQMLEGINQEDINRLFVIFLKMKNNLERKQ